MDSGQRFFDEYSRFLSTSSIGSSAARLNARHDVIIKRHESLIRGKRILDIGSHDGRWSFAALKSGCSHVIGIEPRQHLVDAARGTLSSYAVSADRYDFIVGDAFDVLKQEQFRVDTILVLGFFYHIHRHAEFAQLIASVDAENIILDTIILPDREAPSGAALVRLAEEPTDDEGNAFAGEATAIVGFPSRAAISLLFSRVGYQVQEVDWAPHLADIAGIEDYYGGVRATFVLTRTDKARSLEVVAKPASAAQNREPVALRETRLPQGMLRMELPEASLRYSPAAMQGFVNTALQLKKEKGSRVAVDFLMKRIGVELSREYNDEYFSEALHFYIGQVFAQLSNGPAMAEHIGLSRTMPSPEDDLLFSDHVNISHVVRERQLRGIERGIPAIVIASMPRSASGTLTASIAGLLDVPVVHFSAGRFPNYTIAPSWCDAFVQGGAVLHDHFGASDFNIGVLSGRGPRDVFVLVRDLRAATCSQVHFKSVEYLDPDEPFEARFEREYVDAFIPWMNGWMQCAKDPASPLRVHFLSFREVTANLAAAVGKILDVLSRDRPALLLYAAIDHIEETRRHFMKGNDDAWRVEVSTDVAARVWAATPDEMKTLLEMQP